MKDIKIDHKYRKKYNNNNNTKSYPSRAFNKNRFNMRNNHGSMLKTYILNANLNKWTGKPSPSPRTMFNILVYKLKDLLTNILGL